MKWFAIAIIVASLACGGAPGDPPTCDGTEPAEWNDTPLDQCGQAVDRPWVKECYYVGPVCWFRLWCGPPDVGEWHQAGGECAPTDWDGPEFYEW